MKSYGIALLLCMILCACNGSQSDKIPDYAPTKTQNPELRGYLYHHDVVAARNGTFYWAQQVMSGYSKAKDTDFPSEIIDFPNTSCNFEKSVEGEEVHHIHVGGGTQDLPVYSINQKDISKRAERYVQAYIANEGKIHPASKFIGSDQFSVVNVVVSETSKPIYLVLTAQSAVIWNIQPSANAQISHIAIIGHRAAGLANAPQGTEINAVTGNRLRTCRIKPARKPRDHWRFVQNVKHHGTGQDLLAKNRAAASAYAQWFRITFEASSYQYKAGALGVSNALVGDVPTHPEARIPFTSLKDTPLMLSKNDYRFAATRKDYKQKNFSLVKNTAEQAAGGDLSLLLAGG